MNLFRDLSLNGTKPIMEGEESIDTQHNRRDGQDSRGLKWSIFG